MLIVPGGIGGAVLGELRILAALDDRKMQQSAGS